VLLHTRKSVADKDAIQEIWRTSAQHVRGFSGDAILNADFDEIETDRLDAVDDAERLIGITVTLAFLPVVANVNNINMHVSPFSTVFPALTPAVRRRTGRQRRKDFLNFASGKVLATSPLSSQPRRA